LGNISWPELYYLPDDMTPSDLPSGPDDIIHPTILTVNECYISSPHMFRLRGEKQTGVMFLDHKLVHGQNQAYRSRVICVRPDGLSGHYDREFQIFLLWPHEKDSGEGDMVKLVIVSQAEPTVIITGIRSCDMMEEGEWFANET